MKSLLIVVRALFVVAALSVAIGGALWWRNQRAHALGVNRQTWVVSRKVHRGPISRPIGRTLSTYYFTPQEQKVFQQTTPRSNHPPRSGPDKRLRGSTVAMEGAPTTPDGSATGEDDKSPDSAPANGTEAAAGANPEPNPRGEATSYDQAGLGNDTEGPRAP